MTNNYRASHLHLSSSRPSTQPGSLENAAYLGWFLTKRTVNINNQEEKP
ncbi:MAG: hypothetical protein KME55_29050 [Nostoc indistinguendum CM1-VF10]|nr:hypothetical protein [Nostoc indistinguendum CM1-VF10]